MRKGTVDLFKGAAIALSRLRTSAQRDRFTREIDFPLEVGEMGTRLFTQFLTIGLAAHQMGSDWDVVEQMVMRLMIDSVPYVRSKMLRAIRDGANEPRLLYPMMQMAQSQIGRNLEELKMLGILGMNKNRKWEITNPVIAHALSIEQ
jgi:hypothetical protein